MQPVTTQPNTISVTTNNQTDTTLTTTLYPNDVTWESVGKYVHLFNQCWSFLPDRREGKFREHESCDFKGYQIVTDLGINYPCTTLKEDFGVYIEKALKLSDYICPRSDLVKVFDSRANAYENYDNANYINQLLIGGTSFSAAAVGASVIVAFFSAFNKLDTQDTEGISCTTKYWLPITLLASSIVPTIMGSITAAAWANDDLPSGGKDCIEYHLLQDMGQLAQNVTGIDYL